MSTLFDAIQYLDAALYLFKGEPGTRKSTAALSFPLPQYWFSIDQKMESLVVPARNWGIDFTQIKYDDYGAASKHDTHSKIKKKLEEFQLSPSGFKTLIFDSVSSAGDSVNLDTMYMKSGTTTDKGTEKGKRIGGIPVAGLEEYNAESGFFIELLGLLKDIRLYHRINIILIAHVMEPQMDAKTATVGNFVAKSRLLATGGRKISAKIPAHCTEVYHFNLKPNIDPTKGGNYEILTQHTFLDFARTAFNLPANIEFNDKPLYQLIKPYIDKLRGEK